jgi:hypothetical protein
MKGFSMKTKTTFITLLMILLSGVATAQITESSSSRSNWTWVNSDDGKKIEVRIENKVEFNEDYSDVANIPGDGALSIYDSRGPHKIRLLVTRGSAGELKRNYFVDGDTRTFDNEARAWLRKVLLEAVRQGGLDARNRVQRIIQQRGARAVAEEITYLKGDYVRRIYFEAFLQASGLSTDDLKTAIRNASQTIDSDYERAQMLLQVAPVFVSKQELVADYFMALNRLQSDYERRRTLSGLLKREQLSRETLSAMAMAAKALGSDYEKAVFLLHSINRYHSDDRLRADWFNAVSTIGSDYEHHRVLSGLLKVPGLSINALVDAMESAMNIQSDYEKASFLIEALNHYQSEARLRTALMNVAKTITSEYERGRVQKRLDRIDY